MQSYQDVLDYLYKQLPMFQRLGQAALRKPSLDKTYALAELLGQPQEAFPCIHVGGTNGKGSTAHLLAAALQAAGYKVGLYSSPHYCDFRERVKINGDYIPKEQVQAFVLKNKKAFDELQPSFFEWSFALALDYFRHEQIDVAVVEVGLGGRLDSTNILRPLLSVITNIGFDHQEFLGYTLERIAWEKAGIIKPETPVLIGEEHKKTRSVFWQKANAQKAPLRMATESYRIEKLREVSGWGWPLYRANALRENYHSYQNICLGLNGGYQERNMRTALAALAWLEELGHFPALNAEVIALGFERVQELSRLIGRWQILDKEPLIIADGAHNAEGIALAVEQLGQYQYEQLHWILAIVKDKDRETMLGLLPKQAQYYISQANIPRALDKEQLLGELLASGRKGQSYESLRHAFDAAYKAASPRDLIFVGGSIFTVGEILELFQ